MASNAENVSIWWRHYDQGKSRNFVKAIGWMPCSVSLLTGSHHSHNTVVSVEPKGPPWYLQFIIIIMSILGAVTPDQPPSTHPEAPQPTMPIVFFDKAKKDPDRRTFHEHLSEYFLHMEHCERRTQELPYQLMMCGNMTALSEVLSEPRYLQAMPTYQRCHHFASGNHWELSAFYGLRPLSC